MMIARLLPLLLLATTPVFAADFVVESRREGKNYDAYSEVSGPWLDSNIPANTAKSAAPGCSPQGQVGTRKSVVESALNQTSSSIIAAARFQVKVPSPGRYYVYATWPKAANASPVQYLVRHGNKSEAVAMIQDGWGSQGRSNADSWNLIGGFDFTMNGEEYVELQVPRNVAPANPVAVAQVFADAIRISSTPLPAEQLSAVAPAAGSAPVGGGTSAPATGGANLQKGLPSAVGAGPIQWSTNFDLARSEASATNRGLLLFFVNAGSERVRRIEADVLETPRVRQAIAGKYVPVKLDMTANEELARRLQVYRAGTVLIYDNQFQGVAEITDPRSPEDVASHLK